jgi:hypothetical protein
MQSSAVFEKQHTWHSTEPEVKGASSWKRWAVGGGLAAIVLVFASGLLIGHGPVSGLEAQRTALSKQVTGLDHRIETIVLNHAHCYTDGTEVSDIQGMLNKAEYQSAAALAHLALTNVNHPPCPQTQAGLGALWYSASMDELLSTPAGSPMDQAPILTWLGIEREADALGLVPSERLNPLTVFSLAYSAHSWRLARAAFRSAWSRQVVGPADLNDLVRYYADLRNLGLALSSQARANARYEGYLVLATANAIDRRFGLGQGEADSDLIRLLGTAAWPHPDWSDPVLAATRNRRIER